MAKKKKSPVSPWSLTSFLIFLGILAAIVLFVFATQKPTRIINFAACNDSGCQNVLHEDTGFWMITNCAAPGDADGDQQLCNGTGRIGICRGTNFCCPAAGAQWTTNMSACAGATNTPVPSRTPTIPQPSATRAPTNAPQPTSTRVPTRPPLPTSTRRPTSTIRPSITRTPTPIPKLVDVCGKSCVSDADCQLDLTCATVFGNLKACRNRSCTDSTSCNCDNTGGQFTFSTPTPGPETGDVRTLPITIKRFTDSKKQTGTQPTLSGTSEPDSKITVTIYPDGVGGEVYADKNGNWTFRPSKKLTPGEKNLLIVATKPGAQGQISEQFTVVGGGGINFKLILTILVLIALGFGVYVYIKSNQ